MLPVLNLKSVGFIEAAKRFANAGAAFLRAREYALASTAKMIRNKVRDFGRKIQPKQSPFTSLIAKYHTRKASQFKNSDAFYQENAKVGEGARKEAFHFAQFLINRRGVAGAKEATSVFSRVRQAELRRQIRIKEKGYAKRSKRLTELAGRAFDANDRVYKKKNKGNFTNELRAPFKKLINFVRSRIDAHIGKATIGFYKNEGEGEPNSQLENIMKQQAAGYTTQITERMRRFFFAIGFPTGANTLTTPARPWFQPVYNAIKDQIITHFNEKFLGRFMPSFKGGPMAPDREAA
ncbi:MAG: hypothetical protein HQM10_26530 [Candidatus Riflebacteria bacterium]|nr:hypothetical protein [Candidatus Riflebacteria bacterium]